MAADGGTTQGIDVDLHDPHVTDQTLDLTDIDTATDGADAIVLTTDHDEYEELDPTPIAERMQKSVVIDTKAHLDAERWDAAGFTVRQI